MADRKPQTCPVCVRQVQPARWEERGYECAHVECPHRRRLTAAPSRPDDGATPARGAHE